MNIYHNSDTYIYYILCICATIFKELTRQILELISYVVRDVCIGPSRGWKLLTLIPFYPCYRNRRKAKMMKVARACRGRSAACYRIIYTKVVQLEKREKRIQADSSPGNKKYSKSALFSLHFLQKWFQTRWRCSGIDRPDVFPRAYYSDYDNQI